MARSQVSYGSRGEDVSELQRQLNNNGYNLEVDGIFGAKTQEAVRDYQSKNGLAVDGIVGVNTWGALTGGASASQPQATTMTQKTGLGGGTRQSALLGKNTSTGTKAPTPQQFSYSPYQESDAVKQAQALLQQQLSSRPGEYQSQWQDTLNELLNQIQNREKFSYDLNGDALYQQYKDRYIQQGQQAMMDTMGQAAAMTGGYGSSYAQSAGQQTYQGYLQGLNDKIPELYQLALDRYNQDGQDLYNQFALIGDRENQDYSRYRDSVSDFYAELDRLYNQYLTEREYDYGRYNDDRGFAYQTNRDNWADQQWKAEYDEAMRQYNQQLQYQQGRDQVSDQQWQAEFDEAKRQFDQQYALSASKASGGSGGSSGGRGGSSGGSRGSSSSGSGGEVTEKTYNNGMTASEIESAANSYYKSNPNIALDSRALDMWLSNNGYSGDSATAFKAYLQSYGATTSRR